MSDGQCQRCGELFHRRPEAFLHADINDCVEVFRSKIAAQQQQIETLTKQQDDLLQIMGVCDEHRTSKIAMTLAVENECKQCMKQQIETWRAALTQIQIERNGFSGPSPDYIQGYRDGQQHLQDIAREALESKP